MAQSLSEHANILYSPCLKKNDSGIIKSPRWNTLKTVKCDNKKNVFSIISKNLNSKISNYLTKNYQTMFMSILNLYETPAKTNENWRRSHEIV